MTTVQEERGNRWNMRASPQVEPGEVQVGHQKEFLHGKHCPALERASLRGGGVCIPGDVQGMTGHGTQRSGQGDKVGISQRLDLMTLVVFPNPNDSVMPTDQQGEGQHPHLV